MEAARALPISVEEYLALEETGEVRHEYVGGSIHAMSGASEPHNTITGNIFAALRTKLRGGPCRVYIETFKLRLAIAREDIFYYPDVVVSCHPTGITRQYLHLPTLVVEVLSPSTENTDLREKKLNYMQAPTLEEYVIVAQDRREVTIFRRATGWEGEIHTAPEAVVEFRSLKQAMTVAEIYEDVF
ncbi:MAG: Uma2 family endonuclease [Opitutaceae bacterium]|nr:Uma2 family endonuclease [Opitutaceae bacterium]